MFANKPNQPRANWPLRAFSGLCVIAALGVGVFLVYGLGRDPIDASLGVQGGIGTKASVQSPVSGATTAATVTTITQASAATPTVQPQAVSAATVQPKLVPTFTPPSSQAALEDLRKKRLAELDAAPSAEANLKLMPMPPDATAAETDDRHHIVFNVKSAPIDVVQWYTARLRDAGYSPEVTPLPAGMPMRMVQFSTLDGRRGAVIVLTDKSKGTDTQVEIAIQ